MAKERIINFCMHTSESGTLCVFETGDMVPFVIKRIFTVKGKTNEIRGNHAHKICQQLLVCVSGKIEVTCDDGARKDVYKLDEINKGLLIPAGIWASEKFLKKETVLMVLCDRNYEENDYIRNYEEYKNSITTKMN